MKFKNQVKRLFFPAMGLGAMIWFLIRVIPKPTRATYPCMRAAFPVATSFIVYILGIFTSFFALKQVKIKWQKARYASMIVFFIVALISGFIVFQNEKPHVYADSFHLDTANEPMGTAIGIHPGRVVWTWNPDATNENCRNNSLTDVYYLPQNSDMAIIQDMVDQSILTLTGETSISAAWEALFKSFNERKGRDAVNYSSGEKIFIKTNFVGSSQRFSRFNSNYSMSRTSPQPVLAILRQLINHAGVPQNAISVGDPMKDMQDEFLDVLYAEFPDVKYMDHSGGTNRTKTQFGTSPIIYYSDKGEVLRDGGNGWSDASDGDPVYQDHLYKCIEDADYMINIPALKAHHRAGITIQAKCHFGSHTRAAAKHLHMGLINPDGQPVSNPKRAGYGLYRIQVDLMGHEKLGGNTMLSVVDGLWGSPDANDTPEKFKTEPFNNDWPSSIILSQDQIALESVCFDILKKEFTSENHSKTYPQMEGVDDYLHQAADFANWPENIYYDPEGDFTYLQSLGVHEHWNNGIDMEYSRNLGTGEGIELVKLMSTSAVENNAQLVDQFELGANFPNPFNPSTQIPYTLSEAGDVQLEIYNISGQKIYTLVSAYQTAGSYQARWFGRTADGMPAGSGVYLARLTVNASGRQQVQTRNMLLMK